jgi:nucleotide-binding universal stress UspA family protein
VCLAASVFDQTPEGGSIVQLAQKLVASVDLEFLITRGALTTFSVANDIAKYFAIIPTIFAAAGIGALNVMGLKNAESAIVSALIYNALIIPVLILLALKGVRFRVLTAAHLNKDESLHVETCEKLCQEFEGQFLRVRSTDVARAIAEVAEQERITQIVIGESQQSRWKQLLKGSFTQHLMNLIRHKHIDLHIIGHLEK